MAESLLVGRKFVSGICKLKSKKPLKLKKTFKNVKKTIFKQKPRFLPALLYSHIHSDTGYNLSPS